MKIYNVRMVKTEMVRGPPKLCRNKKILFSCPEQLNRWPCHSLTQSITDSGYFYFWHYRVTLETCDLWDICSEWWEDMTWPKEIDKDKYKDNDEDKDKDILRTPSKSHPRELWPLRHLFRVIRRHDMTKKLTKTNTKTKTMTKT